VSAKNEWVRRLARTLIEVLLLPLAAAAAAAAASGFSWPAFHLVSHETPRCFGSFVREMRRIAAQPAGCNSMALLLSAAVLLPLLASSSSAQQLPLWEPVWQLNRSTAANVCNRSSYMDLLPGGGDLGEFGLVNFDWSNNRATWSGANGKSPPNMCEQALIEQCNM
jgi:hypothetical protein